MNEIMNVKKVNKSDIISNRKIKKIKYLGRYLFSQYEKLHLIRAYKCTIQLKARLNMFEMYVSIIVFTMLNAHIRLKFIYLKVDFELLLM